MNQYTLGAMVSLILFGMAMTALILGIETFRRSGNSHAARRMFYLFICVAVWDAGYAWMGLCYGDDFAYIPRAIALLGVYFYMIMAIEYVAHLSNYPTGSRYTFYVLYGIAAIASWIKIIGKGSVTFIQAPWGYWYVSTMTWGRYLQFACILLAILFYFFILSYWRKMTVLKRELLIIRRFMLFAPIMFAGYIFDTLLPSLYEIPAIPGSAVSAFISATILYGISQRYMAFGITSSNISKYVFRDVAVPVLVMNAEGKTVMCNNAATEYLGVSESELNGRTRDDLLSLPDEEELLDDTGGEEIYTVSGKDLYCKISQTAYYDTFGDLMYTILFIHDMTDVREAMRLMNESRISAEAANDSKSAFLTNMSHEIRTPMSAIMGMSDILLADPMITGDERQQVRNIREAGDSMLGIINDVLDISKIEAGQNELVEISYSLPDMIHAINSMVRVKIAETPLEYIVDVDPSLPRTIIGDELRIRQIFLNILGYSIRVTEEGYVHLKIWGKREYGGIRLYADFSDTGMGMHPEETGHIFEAFSQVDTHRNAGKQGTGLGLSISLKLAEAMDGTITVESEYGHGTTFHLNLFQRIKEDEPIGEQTVASIMDDSYEFKDNADEFEYHEHKGKRVLVVDDSRVNLMVAKGLFAPYGMDVDLVNSGKKAIEMARINIYNCIFMDHMMPEMDGVETTHSIRALGGHNMTVPIVALTANAVDGTREQLLAQGMQDFIAKPIDKKTLNDIVEKYC